MNVTLPGAEEEMRAYKNKIQPATVTSGLELVGDIPVHSGEPKDSDLVELEAESSRFG